MRSRLSLLLFLLLATPAYGAIAFDAVTTNAQTTGDLSFSHTPVGTPRGVLVYVVTNAVGSDEVVGITYGGTAMTETASSPVVNSTGELGASHCFFLGSSVPAGAQTVAVDVGAGTVSIAACVTVTAANDTSVVTTGSVLSNNTATTTTTLLLGGVSSFCMTGFWTGLNAVTNFAPLTGWTERIENDFTSQCAGIYTYDTVGTTDVSAGYTNSGGDDAALHNIAIRENAVVGGSAAQVILVS